MQMTSKFGRLGFQPDDRYRNVPEPRIIEMLAFAGWPDQSQSAEARTGAPQALERWTRSGLGFRISGPGERCYDPIEVYNQMKLAGVEERDDFFFEKFSLSRRNAVASLAAALENGRDRFAVDFQRTFYLSTTIAGTKLRLRLPLPLEGDQLSDLQIVPRAANGQVELKIGPGRLEARLVCTEPSEVVVGASMQFTVCQRTATSTSLIPPDAALYLASREGMIVISDRVRALARSLAPAGAPTLEAVRAFWDHLQTKFICGLVHYDQVDPAAPCDWVLDAGWYDCQLASALFVALCRAHGIPSRLVGGYFLYPTAPTNHFWAEVWLDEEGWKPFDFFGWDISNGGRLREWRDRFYGRLDPRLITERLPREFTGALGLPIPPAWCILQTPSPGGVAISFLDVSGAPVYRDVLRVSC